MTQLTKYCHLFQLLYCSLAQSSRALPKDTATAHGKWKASVSTKRSDFGGKGSRSAPVLIKHPRRLFDLLFHGGETGLRPLPHDEPIGARSRDTWPRSVWEEWVSAFYRFPKGTSRQKNTQKMLLFRAWCRQNVKLPKALLHGIIRGLFWDFLRQNGNGKQWEHESNQTSCSVLYWSQSKCDFNQKRRYLFFFLITNETCPFAVYCIHRHLLEKTTKRTTAACRLQLTFIFGNILLSYRLLLQYFPPNLLHWKRTKMFLKLL